MNHPILILSLHHCSPEKDALTISPEIFEAMLQEIQKLGFTFLNYQEFQAIIFGQKKAEKKQVLLTFDDGYYDNFAFAFPLLKKYKIPAVIFLISSKIQDKKREKAPKFLPHKIIEEGENLEQFLTLDEIREMENSSLIEFDSHSFSHFSCNSEDEEALESELQSSFLKMKELFPNKKNFGFCWPKGEFNAKALKIIKNSPYSFAFSTLDGAYLYGDNLFTIRRIDFSSAKKGEKDYLQRLRKKLRLYSCPILGKLYSKYKNRKSEKAKF